VYLPYSDGAAVTHVSSRTIHNSQTLCSFTYSVQRLSSLAQQCNSCWIVAERIQTQCLHQLSPPHVIRMCSCEMILQSSESTGFVVDRRDISSEIASECHCNTRCMGVISWRMATFSLTSQDVTSGRISSLAAMSYSSCLFSAATSYRNCWRVVFCTSQIL